MKRTILPVLFSLLVIAGFGQDLKKATSLITDKKYAEAKAQIDGALAKDPNNTEALYLKSRIYTLMAANPDTKAQLPGDPYGEAFDAFKKAIADSNNGKVTLRVVKDNYQPIFDVYSGYFGEGAEAFNNAAGTKDAAGFTKAMELFQKAEAVGQYIADNKWATIGKVDTILVLNIGKAALNAKKNDVAREYFKKLADAHIKGLKDSADENYELPYQWLELDYKEAKDTANMNKYAALGRQFFPNDDYFDMVQMDYYRENEMHDQLFAKYDDVTARFPDSVKYHLNYASEIFSYLYNSDDNAVINNKESLLNTLGAQLEKAHTLNSGNPSVNLLYSQYYYNQGITTLEEAQKIRGAKLTPEQQKKKKDLTDEGKNFLLKAVPFSESVISTYEQDFKKTNKSRYKTAANLMQNIYQSIGDKDKLKIYQDKYDQADAKFVN